VPGGHNSVAVFDLAEFRAYLAALEAAAASPGDAVNGVTPPAPAYRVVHLALPPIAEPDGARRSFQAGVSSASTVRLPVAAGDAPGDAAGDAAGDAEFLLLGASYEATLNEIDDGPVLGSRVALLPSAALLAAAARGSGAAVPTIDLSALSALIVAPGGGSGGGAPVVAKVEGIAARGGTCGVGAAAGCARVEVLAVTDPDGEASQLLEIDFEVPAALLAAAAAPGGAAA
jgi:hypothetical protein